MRMKNNLVDNIKNLFIRFFPFILVFSYSIFMPSDSDMGWHLKYGEYFFRNGEILRNNIFSTMMPDFHWVNSSWATDLVTYFTFSRFGFLGVSILAALIVTVIFYLFSKIAKLTFWEQAILFPLILYLEEPFIEVSLRGQLITILSVSVLYFLFHLYMEGKKKALYFIIPLFTLWSNLHGQFILGLGIFLLFIVFHSIHKYLASGTTQEKMEVQKKLKTLLFVYVVSIIATLINPYGISIYTEALKHFGNPLQKFIIEWLPFDRFSLLWWNLMLWEAVIIVSIGIIIYKKRFWAESVYIIPTIILLVLSVQVRRYMWVLLPVSIPLAKVFISAIKPKFEEIAATISLILVFSFYGYIIFVKIPSENISQMNWDKYCALTRCSPKSAEYLLENYPSGKLMTFYNWGGWLIAQYPNIKVSIDGRMHLWRYENGYSAFLDYYPYEQNRKDIDLSDYDAVYMSPVKPVHKRLMELVKTGKWKIAYTDPLATLFVREKTGK